MIHQILSSENKPFHNPNQPGRVGKHNLNFLNKTIVCPPALPTLRDVCYHLTTKLNLSKILVRVVPKLRKAIFKNYGIAKNKAKNKAYSNTKRSNVTDRIKSMSTRIV